MENTKQWTTHLPDPNRKNGRRLIRRNSYEKLCQAVIEFYVEDMSINMTLDTLFDDWIIFRRDETSAKPGSIRKFASLWRTHCRQVSIDGKLLSEWKVTDITPKILYRFFRKITKDRTYSRQMVSDIRCVLSGMFLYAVEHDIIQVNPVRDVDLNEKKLYICHQITYEPKLNDDLTFTEKKMVTENYLKGCTSQGYRMEYLTYDAIDILRQAKAINPDGDFVFMPFGKPILTTTFNKRLRKYCETAGIPYRSSHKIRFYAASTAYDGNNLVSVSRMMGCGMPVACVSHRPSRQTRPARPAPHFTICAM